MYKRLSFLARIVFITGFIFMAPVCFVAASNTDGTISAPDSVGYFSNSVLGPINFGATNGNVHVLDTGMTGHAWSSKYGWINLAPVQGGVLNNAEGVLRGHAWGENIGWINFRSASTDPISWGVSIDASGYFHGYAWSEKFGWISFNCANDNSCGSKNFSIRTDWRPASGRGGGGGQSNPIVVSLSPSAVSVSQSGTVQFVATVTGTLQTDVTWEVIDSGGGSVNAAGLYTAPAVPGVYRVKATSVADTSKFATAEITVVAQTFISITISPEQATTTPGQIIQFTSTVSGTTSQAVLWFLDAGANNGSIGQTGAYTAPAATGTYRVYVKSLADQTKVASAVVSVVDTPVQKSISIEPVSVTISVGQSYKFNSNQTPASQTVVWSVEESNGGTITAEGIYTAPTVPGTYHIVAVIAGNPTVQASATIIVEALPTVSVGITPSSISIFIGEEVDFISSVMGANDKSVSWSIQERDCGTISIGGVYSSPSHPAVCHIIARSNADASASAIAVVNVSDREVLPPPPPSCVGDECNPSSGGGEEEDYRITTTTTPAAITTQIKESYETLATSTAKVVSEVKKIVETPAGNAVTKTVSTVGVVASGAAAASTLFMNPISFSELFFLPFRLWSLLVATFGLRKRFHPWGVVYDSVTKQPLDPAYVVLTNEKGEEVLTSITDLDGRYGFLAQSGTYKIVANKTNYIFPSTKLAGRAADELYNNLYFGEQVEVTAENTFIDKNIPLDPDKFDWNEYAKRDKGLIKFHSRRDRLMRRVTDWMFRVGFVVALVSLIAIPQPYNFVIFGLYIMLAVMRYFGIKPKPYGMITEKATGNPLTFAIIRIMSPSLNKEIFHRVTDRLGRYYCLLPKGDYYLNIEKKNDDGTYSLIYTSGNINAYNGVINKDFQI